MHMPNERLRGLLWLLHSLHRLAATEPMIIGTAQAQASCRHPHTSQCCSAARRASLPGLTPTAAPPTWRAPAGRLFHRVPRLVQVVQRQQSLRVPVRRALVSPGRGAPPVWRGHDVQPAEGAQLQVAQSGSGSSCCILHCICCGSCSSSAWRAWLPGARGSPGALACAACGGAPGGSGGCCCLARLSPVGLRLGRCEGCGAGCGALVLLTKLDRVKAELPAWCALVQGGGRRQRRQRGQACRQHTSMTSCLQHAARSLQGAGSIAALQQSVTAC